MRGSGGAAVCVARAAEEQQPLCSQRSWRHRRDQLTSNQKSSSA